MLGFVLLVARWCGVRGYGFVLVGLAAVVFFVLLARPEPSVLRAAAMGVVALAGLTSGGRRRGHPRALRRRHRAGAARPVAGPVGRASSCRRSATAGILLLAPAWRDALARWMPRWLAEAIAVPLAAQLVCTPVVAAISGQVSLVAVASNLLAAPAVGPATVLGLVSGLVDGRRPSRSGSSADGWPEFRRGGSSRWRERSARLDGASTAGRPGPSGRWLAGAALPGRDRRHAALLRRGSDRAWPLVAVIAVAVVRPGGRVGWPPPDWLMVMCDVGQGDGAGAQRRARCGRRGRRRARIPGHGPLPRRAGVATVPLVVLTHFHADHVDGLAGVLEGRDVGRDRGQPVARAG